MSLSPLPMTKPALLACIAMLLQLLSKLGSSVDVSLLHRCSCSIGSIHLSCLPPACLR